MKLKAIGGGEIPPELVLLAEHEREAPQQGDAERMLILVDIERLMASADMGLVAHERHQGLRVAPAGSAQDHP